MGVTRTQIRFEKIRDFDDSEGKNSQAFIAKDLQLDAELFIKKISKKLLDKQELKIEDYFLESRMLYAGKHPNIAEIQYASEDDENIYLAMPIYSNGSLNTLINVEYLSVRDIIKYSLDILSGLSYIHSKKMLHLDIKPTNILIDSTGRARITDFGISRFSDDYGFAEQDFIYTLHREPEIYKTNKRSISSDIYQFGLLLYRMCNGNDILKGQIKDLNISDWDSFFDWELLKNKIVKGLFPDRKYFLPHIPNKLINVVKKCLNVDIEKRYSNVIDIMNDLSEIDNCLDWKYFPDSSIIYERTLEDKMNIIEIKEDNNLYSIVYSIINMQSMKKRKKSEFCHDKISDYHVVMEKIMGIIKDIG